MYNTMLNWFSSCEEQHLHCCWVFTIHHSLIMCTLHSGLQKREEIRAVNSRYVCISLIQCQQPLTPVSCVPIIVYETMKTNTPVPLSGPSRPLRYSRYSNCIWLIQFDNQQIKKTFSEEINPSKLPIQFVLECEGLYDSSPFVSLSDFAASAVVGKKMLCSSVIGGPAIISQRVE